MDTEEIKKQYNSLLKSGELKKILPVLKGKWEEDKKLFTRYCEENDKILNDNFMDIDVDFEDVYDEYE